MSLIDYNANMKIRDKDGKLPIDLATNYHVIKFLRDPYSNI